MVKLGNFWYFFFILLAVGITIGLYFLLAHLTNSKAPKPAKKTTKNKKAHPPKIIVGTTIAKPTIAVIIRTFMDF